jgi:succinate dehydrogenase flavin-adding protein (antitoxin of CptAB toxin-antitoxin module)
MSESNRVRWHCRRGMLELDLVLARFLDRHLATLTPGQHAAFKTLLEDSDNDLWDLVSGHGEPAGADPDMLTVIRLLRDV